ncbi:hypothetical protein DDU56_22705 [Salmonella enterica]|nr:hypothetical protein [Salmonella enterica]
MLGGADNPNGELPSYITGADTSSYDKLRAIVSRSIPHPSQVDKDVSTLIQILVFLPLIPNVVLHVEYGS